MGLRRFLLTAVLAVAASLVIIPSAAADDFADQPCPDVAGPDTSTCPAGRVNVPYTLQFQLADGSGCGPGHTTWSVSTGSLPPGLSLNSGSGAVTGTPTQAGNFTFYITVSYPVIAGFCNGGFSDHKFTIPINPEVPRLVLQPEQAGVPTSTVSAPYSLQMTSNLPDTKTWSLAAGGLPTGVNLNSSTGLISGTPSVAGTYNFTVAATLTPDPLQSPARTDTKALQIVVRPAVIITAGDPFISGPTTTKWEVGVPFDAALTATGGTGTFTWALAPATSLPDGLELSTTDGSITGTPLEAGVSRIAVRATDTEGRIATFNASLVIAARLAILVRPLPAGRVGKAYKFRLRTTGGVAPMVWRIKTGPLPRGIRFDRKLGVLAGTPTRAGRYRITVEVRDELGVKSTKSFLIVVRAAPPKR